MCARSQSCGSLRKSPPACAGPSIAAALPAITSIQDSSFFHTCREALAEHVRRSRLGRIFVDCRQITQASDFAALAIRVINHAIITRRFKEIAHGMQEKSQCQKSLTLSLRKDLGTGLILNTGSQLQASHGFHPGCMGAARKILLLESLFIRG